MKLTLWQRILYTIFFVLNIVFSSMWLATLIIIGLACSIVKDPKSDAVVGFIMLFGILFYIVKLFFPLSCYIFSKNIRELLNRFSSDWELVKFAFLFDLVVVVLQIPYNIYENIPINTLFWGNLMLLGGVMPCYVILVIFKKIWKHVKTITIFLTKLIIQPIIKL